MMKPMNDISFDKPVRPEIGLRLSLIILVSMTLASCGGDEGDLTRYINKIKSRPARQIEPIPEFAPLAKFQYPEDIARRSPFLPIEKKKKTDEQAPNQNRPKDPLESFPLDALKFVGILREGRMTWALIRLPDDKIARVRVGEYMGQNFGVVLSIKDNLIKLQETVQVAGKWQKKTTLLRLNVQD